MENDLISEIMNRSKQLDISIRQLRKSAEDYATAYTDYRIALAKELISLKEEGYAITLAGDIARGKPSIAKLKFDEITKEAVYKANQEAIQAIKLQIRLLDSQISREWHSGGENL